MWQFYTNVFFLARRFGRFLRPGVNQFRYGLSLLVASLSLTAAWGQNRTLVEVTPQQLPNLPALTNGAQSWGDYDKDGRLDLLVIGQSPTGFITRLYHNSPTGFEERTIGYPGLAFGSVTWVDYDIDGWLDFMLTGWTGTQSVRILAYNLEGRGFEDRSELLAQVPALSRSAVSWADYDGDGRPDLVVSGLTDHSNPASAFSQLYLQTASGFQKAGAPWNLPPVSNGSLSSADFNRDDQPDLLLTGYTGNEQQVNSRISKLYLSTPAGFVDASGKVPDLPGVDRSSVAVGDYDGDGWSDMMLTGSSRSGPVSKLYHSKLTGAWNSFEVASTGFDLPNLRMSKAAWADYNNDGRPDLLLMGITTNKQPFTKLYRNTAGGFVDASEVLPGLPQVMNGMMAWGDYDKDGKVDLALAGDQGGSEYNYALKVYHNTGGGFEEVSGELIKGSGFPLAKLLPATNGSVAWIDYARGGQLSLFYMGYAGHFGGDVYGSSWAWLVFNNSPGWKDEGIIGTISPNTNGFAEWADFDRDGVPDVMIAGNPSTYNFTPYKTNKQDRQTQLYYGHAYTGNGKPYFDLVKADKVLPPTPDLVDGAMAWGDYDNDGWPDMVFTGNAADGATSRLYHNNAGQKFSDVSSSLPNLPGLQHSSVAWGDFDKDGRLDLMMTGQGSDSTLHVRLYHNTGAGFEDASNLLPSVPGLYHGSSTWIDFDQDGQLDLLLTGETAQGAFTKLYRNKGVESVFEETSSLLPGLPALTNGTADWADYDRDGRPDLLLTGQSNGEQALTKLYHNTAGGFADVSVSMPSLPPVSFGATAWGDYDNDGFVDLLVTGSQDGTGPVSKLLRNFQTDVSGLLPNLPQLSNSAVAWGDYDNDGRLDLIITGTTSNLRGVSRLYHNTGRGFEDQSGRLPDLPQLGFGAVAWGDYDNDGRLDVLLTGSPNTLTGVSKLYHNTGSGFEDASRLIADLPQVRYSAVAWGDYDNDGRLDLIITGQSGSSGISKLYHNTGSSFEDRSSLLAGLPQVRYSAVAWADYDRDGWLDVLITGRSGSTSVSKLYHNTGSGFEDRSGLLAGLPQVERSAVAFGDYDNDGWLDLLITGQSGFSGISKLYHNTGRGFEDRSSLLAGLPQIADGAVVWGDVDSNGWLDVLMMGYAEPNGINKLYLGNPDGFRDASNLLTSLNQQAFGSAALGDYDNDGRLDLVMIGDNESHLYNNAIFSAANPVPANSAPSAPTNLSSILSADGQSATLSWQPATDVQTPPAGLHYNLYVSDFPVGPNVIQDILSPMADANNGFRRVVRLGNSQGLSATLTGLTPNQTYYWSVQAVDGAFAGSAFAPEQSFTRSLLGGAESEFQLVAPLYNCQTGAFTFQTQSGDGSSIEYMAPGITAWTTNPRQWVDQGLRQAADAQPITLMARQSGQEVRYVFDLRALCPVGDSNQFRLVSPLYDCQSGAFTFRTQGGDGSPIEYRAPGITAWSSNPNQFVDQGLRTAADAQPLTLVARQGNQEVRYVWDIRAVCPADVNYSGARQGVAAEPGVGQRVQVYPNPVESELTVRMEGVQNQPVNLRLTNLHGQVVLERTLEDNQSAHQERLPLAGLPSGVYLLRVSTTQQHVTLKVIKR